MEQFFLEQLKVKYFLQEKILKSMTVVKSITTGRGWEVLTGLSGLGETIDAIKSSRP